MTKVNIYKFTVKEQVKNEDGEMVNVVEFAGETKEEAASYVKMAGFTIVTFDGIEEESKPQESIYEYPDYIAWCNAKGLTPS